jgi:hypothetical protein
MTVNAINKLFATDHIMSKTFHLKYDVGLQLIGGMKVKDEPSKNFIFRQQLSLHVSDFKDFGKENRND